MERQCLQKQEGEPFCCVTDLLQDTAAGETVSTKAVRGAFCCH